MPHPRLNPEFVIQIASRNERGETTGEKEFVTYAGLLALAHDLGLEEIHTTILQMPTEANEHTAVVRAIAKGKPGLYSGLGDASPANTNRKVARHLIRVAETRAKARALRDLTNVSLVAFEELGGDDDTEDTRREPPHARHTAPTPITDAERRRPVPASDAQRRALFRLAYDAGYQAREAGAFLAQRLGMDVDKASREAASALIDKLVAEGQRRTQNGGRDAAE
jgi:hypothetical protein